VIGGSGRIIRGRYRLEGLLGGGGGSEVHHGTDLRLNRPVAVKLFRPGADPESARRFDEEAHTLANLSHPGLVPVYDSGLDGDQPYLVQELVSGWTLREVMSQEDLPLDEVIRIGTDLSDVLDYVHEQGITHRDIKPSNVLIGRDNRVRLTDFATARPDRRPLGAAYLSPEQVRGEWVGPPADIYALGLVLLEALTGRQEYPGNSREAAEARLERAPQIPAELPGGVRRALLAMTEPDPDERPTAAQVGTLLNEEPEPVAVVSAPGPQPRGTGGQVAVIVIGALLLAALIGFVVFATSDDDDTNPTRSSTASANSSATRSPATTRKTTPTDEPETTTETTAKNTPKSPTSGLALPELPDISLPDAPDISGSVTDEVKKAWEKFTAWLSGLF
jgi:serine/threonine protein kinase